MVYSRYIHTISGCLREILLQVVDCWKWRGLLPGIYPTNVVPLASHPPTHFITPTAKSVQCAAAKCAGKLDSELEEKPHVLGEMQVEPMRNKSLALWRWHV